MPLTLGLTEAACYRQYFRKTLLMPNLLEIWVTNFSATRNISWTFCWEKNLFPWFHETCSVKVVYLVIFSLHIGHHPFPQQMWRFQPILVVWEDCLHMDCCDMTNELPPDLLQHSNEKRFLLSNDTIAIHFSASMSHQKIENLFHPDWKTIPAWYTGEEIIWLVLAYPNLPSLTSPCNEVQKHLSFITFLPCSDSQTSLVELHDTWTLSYHIFLSMVS